MQPTFTKGKRYEKASEMQNKFLFKFLRHHS